MLDRVVGRRLASSRKSCLLLGARQVGKTTLLRALPTVRFINLADDATFLSFARDPSLLVRELRAERSRGWVAIDEVQRVPRLLSSVQLLVDEGAPFRFALTGSSARKLRRGEVNLLPGRALLETLDPLLASEVGPSFDIDRALRIGCLPGIYLDPTDANDLLRSYATAYLREEIQAEAIVRDVGTYARFLDLAAETSGQWVNYSKLSSDCEIPKETLRRFYSILEDTLVAFRVPPFRVAHSHRRVSQRDRFVLFDVGVRNALLGAHDGAQNAAARGQLFEQLVLLQCIYFERAWRKGWRISSYRTDAGAEVDIVIDTGRSLVGIECKAGRAVRPAELRGLRSLEETARRPVRKIVVFRGPARQRLEGEVEAIPCLEFLLETLGELR